MVRALLDGSKTQTRRAMRVQPHDGAEVVCGDFHQTVIDRHGDEQPGSEVFGAWWADGECGLCCPYGKPGDQLWVRETWSTHAFLDDVPPGKLTTRSLHYWADGRIQTGKGRPSIHMPRWASRINLEVTGVRVERLQDISALDALEEGLNHCTDLPYRWDHPVCMQTAQRLYSELWEQINGAGSWDLNPWVWVVEFRRTQS